MSQLILLTAFVVVMAFLQRRKSQQIAAYNASVGKSEYFRRDKGTYMVIAMVIMMLLVALRSSKVGNDTEEYIRIFNLINSDADYAETTRYEKGYILLNKLVGKISSNPQSILIVSALIYYPIFIWFFKRHSKDYSMTLLLFFFFVYGSSLTMIRQQIAMAIVFIGVDRILNKHSIRAEIWIIIAMFFHRSAILMVVLPVLNVLKFNFKLAFLIIAVCIIFAFTNLLYLLCAKLLPSYLHYFGGQYAGSGWLAITYKLLSNFVFFVIVFMSYRISKNKLDDHALIKKEKNDNFMLWVSFASFAGFILGYKINLVDRIMFYLTVYFAIFVPNALKKYNQRTADILRAAMIAVLIIYSVVVHLYRPEWGSAYPYQFFWQE